MILNPNNFLNDPENNTQYIITYLKNTKARNFSAFTITLDRSLILDVDVQRNAHLFSRLGRIYHTRSVEYTE